MRTLATLAVPGTYTAAGEVLVGRTVANAQFLRALAEHGSFDELSLVIGETGDLAALEKLTAPWQVPEGRLIIHHVLQLPLLLSTGAISVLHHASHVERLYDLLAIRNRYASKPTPVTGQIHSLSYPRVHQELARSVFLQPAKTDAIFCSSTVGQMVMRESFAQVAEEARARGVKELAAWSLPHVPLGVDFTALQGGSREKMRAALNVPSDAVVILGLARFTEYDKVDLFPLLQVMRLLPKNVYLVLAGARQGTKTPEMLELWAKVMGVEGRLRFKVDFADAEKRDLLAAADVFVSPVDNVQETFGQSVVEAMAAGLPCVVSDFDGYKDTVDASVGARVTTRSGVDLRELSHLAPLLYERPLHLLLGQSIEVDLHSLHHELERLVLDAPLRERLGKAARARAKSEYDWPVVIAKYEAVWRALEKETWSPPSNTAHPLRLDFDRVFASYPTERVADARLVQRTELSRLPGTPWVIYPELKSLLVDDDVQAALLFCEQPQTVEALNALLGAGLQDRPSWVSGFIVTWLLKHGLIETPEASDQPRSSNL